MHGTPVPGTGGPKRRGAQGCAGGRPALHAASQIRQHGQTGEQGRSGHGRLRPWGTQAVGDS